MLTHNILNESIYYISLDSDEERRKNLIINLNKLNLQNNANHITAINGKELENETYRKEISKQLNVNLEKLSPDYFKSKSNFNCYTRNIDDILPRVGCYLSHYLALKKAVDNDLNSVLIIEDDAILLPSILNDFTFPEDADLIYLGGSMQHSTYLMGTASNPSIIQDPKMNENINSEYIKVDPNYLNVYGTFAYYLPTKKAINDLYNVYKSTFLDGKSKVSSKTWYKDPIWKSGNIRMNACPSDRMLIKYFQKYANCYLLNPIRIVHNCNYESNLGSTKYKKQQNRLASVYDHTKQIKYMWDQMCELNNL